MRLYTEATLQIRCNFDAIWCRSSAIQGESDNSPPPLNHLSHLFCDANITSAARLVLRYLQKAAFAAREG
jgi:hypothetical protein